MWCLSGTGDVHTGFRWEALRGKRPLGRPRHVWEDGIKMDLHDLGWDGMDWIGVA